jgi:hypothetical protein
VFRREGAAAAALGVDNTVIMGAPVRVILASALAPPAAPGGPGAAAGSGGRRPTLASFAIADMLSQGYLYGVQGVAHLRRMDERAGLSTRVSVAVSDLDSRFHVHESVSAGYESAKAQAAELDARYGIRAKLDAAARAAAAGAHALAARAMAADPRIAAGVGTAQGLLAKAMSQASDLVQQARVDVRNIDARLAAQAAARAGHVVQPAPAGEAAGAGGAGAGAGVPHTGAQPPP